MISTKSIRNLQMGFIAEKGNKCRNLGRIAILSGTNSKAILADTPKNQLVLRLES